MKACGICGSPTSLRQARGRDARAGPADGRHARRSARARSSTSTATCTWATSSAAEVLEVGPDTVAPGRRHPRHVDPVLLTHDRRAADRLQQRRRRRLRRADAAVGAACSLEVPNGLDFRHAALTEPMAVGLHAVNKSRHHAGEGALVLGCGPVGLAVIARPQAARASRRSSPPTSHPPVGRLATTMGANEVVDPRDEPAFDAWTRAGGGQPLVCSRPSACPGSSTRCCATRRHSTPARGRRRVHGDRPHQPVLRDQQGAQRPVLPRLRPDGVQPTRLRSIAEGELDVAPLITGEVDLDGVPGAFEALANPDEHCKILVIPDLRFRPPAPVGATPARSAEASTTRKRDLRRAEWARRTAGCLRSRRHGATPARPSPRAGPGLPPSAAPSPPSVVVLVIFGLLNVTGVVGGDGDEQAAAPTTTSETTTTTIPPRPRAPRPTWSSPTTRRRRGPPSSSTPPGRSRRRFGPPDLHNIADAGFPFTDGWPSGSSCSRTSTRSARRPPPTAPR